MSVVLFSLIVLYFLTKNIIDFSNVTENLCGEFISITLDGNGFGLHNLDGNIFLDSEGQGSLFDNGYNYVFKNLKILIR